MPITCNGTHFEVSATEKRSLDQYENISYHATLSGEIHGRENLTDAERDHIKQELEASLATVRGAVTNACETRLREDDG